MAGIIEHNIPGYAGYAVKYSPFFNDRIAVAASQNYGLIGNGRLLLLALGATGVNIVKSYDTQDALYDTAWSEANENQLAVASGDGTVKLYDSTVNQFPIMEWKEHTREVYSLSWNLRTKDTFCSSSWDGTIKVYHPQRQQSILTLPTHSCTYSSAFSPHSPSIISSISSDSHLRIFDLRVPASASNHLVYLIPIHGQPPMAGQQLLGREVFPPSECLTHDWNKYRDTVIATGGVDAHIRTFDIRQPKAGPMAVIKGHEYAVRKLAWSPHLSDTLLSASYDMTCRVWTDGTSNQQANTGPRELGRMNRHTEFILGLDWCMFGAEGWCASVSWDKRLLIWDVRSVMGQH